MWTSETLAYMAGILDGEGSIAIEKMSPCKARNYHYFTPRMCIINTSKTLMEWLVNTFGGKYDARKKVEGHRTCYRWHIFGEELEKVTRAVLKYMKIKKDLAQLVLEFRDTVQTAKQRVPEEIRNKREALYKRSRERNTVGDH